MLFLHISYIFTYIYIYIKNYIEEEITILLLW